MVYLVFLVIIQYAVYTLYIHIYIPSAAINIDTSVNAAFTADKLNAANSYFNITDY